MEGTIAINNCGACTKVSKQWLCGRLLKDSTQYFRQDFKSYPTMFTTEVDMLISKLQDATTIQIYQTGVVRLFFECAHFEERHAIYLKDLSKGTLEMLKSI